MYTGSTIADLIELSNSVIELERKYVEAVSKMPPNLCQCLIVQNCEDEYGTLCLKACEPGEAYCPEHRIE